MAGSGAVGNAAQGVSVSLSADGNMAIVGGPNDNSYAGAVFYKGNNMGLDERRKIKELQDITFPSRVKEIEEICGKAIPYEVDWASLADDKEALNFIDNLSCHRLNMALRPTIP